jgi:hypothetical protein
MNKPDSMAKNMPKIVEVKLSSCGFKVADLKKLQLRTCGVAVAEQHFLKSCGIAIAEVLPSSCGIAVADSKKSCACPPLLYSGDRPSEPYTKTEVDAGLALSDVY